MYLYGLKTKNRPRRLVHKKLENELLDVDERRSRTTGHKLRKFFIPMLSGTFSQEQILSFHHFGTDPLKLAMAAVGCLPHDMTSRPIDIPLL